MQTLCYLVIVALRIAWKEPRDYGRKFCIGGDYSFGRIMVITHEVLDLLW